jgi:hypothetical protein
VQYFAYIFTVSLQPGRTQQHAVHAPPQVLRKLLWEKVTAAADNNQQQQQNEEEKAAHTQKKATRLGARVHFMHIFFIQSVGRE